MTDPNRADLELHVGDEEPVPRRRFGCAWLPLLLLALAVVG